MKKITLLIAALFFFEGITSAQSSQLLGMTSNGGANNGGTIFKLNYDGSGFKVLYSFSKTTGIHPYGNLTRANNGLFYGTAMEGGGSTFSAGVIFSFDTSTNKYTVVRTFSFLGGDGYHPEGTLFKANNGLLYGMTAEGGVNDLGVLFSLNPANNVYKKIVDFNGTNGANPIYNSLMQASNGLLYGMTQKGGILKGGVIFSFNISNNTYNSYDVYNSPTRQGKWPNGRLIQASDGNLYATTSLSDFFECQNSEGTILSFNISNSVIKRVYQFQGSCGVGAYGSYLWGSLTEKNAGIFYGLASGEADHAAGLFKFQSSNATATDVFTFNSSANNGALPYGTLLAANDGNLYGMAWAGGASNLGTIFRFNPSDNSFLKIHDFNGAGGANPYADLITCLVPSQVSDITGPAAACFGSTNTYSVNPIAGATSYKWTVPAGSSISGAATGTSIKVVFGSTRGSVTVQAKNACGLSTIRSKSILLHACTTISDQLIIDAKDGLSPNPTKGPVTLRFSSLTSDKYSVKVTDMVGKTVVNIGGNAVAGLNTINFDLGTFAKGIYIVQLSEGDNKRLIKKIVLQ